MIFYGKFLVGVVDAGLIDQLASGVHDTKALAGLAVLASDLCVRLFEGVLGLVVGGVVRLRGSCDGIPWVRHDKYAVVLHD